MGGKHSLIGESKYTTLANLFKKLGHPTRLEILTFLGEHEASVTQIQQHSGLSQALTSQHLKLLYDSKLIDKRRKGTVVLYRTNRDFNEHFTGVMAGFDKLFFNQPKLN